MNDYQATKEATVFSTFESCVGNWEAIPSATTCISTRALPQTRTPSKLRVTMISYCPRLQTMPHFYIPLSPAAGLSLLIQKGSDYMLHFCLECHREIKLSRVANSQHFSISRNATSALLPSVLTRCMS